jgi:hypothetical protein
MGVGAGDAMGLKLGLEQVVLALYKNNTSTGSGGTKRTWKSSLQHLDVCNYVTMA